MKKAMPCLMLLACAIPAQAGSAAPAMAELLGEDPDALAFTSLWDAVAAANAEARDMHPYYQLNLAYFLTFTQEEYDQQLAYATQALSYFNAQIDQPAQGVWSWLDGAGTYHDGAAWADVPYEFRVDALSNAMAARDAFDYTANVLLPLSQALKADTDAAALGAWFDQKYPDVASPDSGDGLAYAQASNVLRRAMMDETGFEGWPIQ